MSKLGRYSAQRRKVEALTASYTITKADCGTIFVVDPAATTNITMPSPSDAGAGWWCQIILAESDGAADEDLDQKVNISFDGERLYGQTFGSDGDTGTQAIFGSNHDWINVSVDASSGDAVDIVCDGSSWFAKALVFDASTWTFGTGAA
jgi:hypothetical protein